MSRVRLTLSSAVKGLGRQWVRFRSSQTQRRMKTKKGGEGERRNQRPSLFCASSLFFSVSLCLFKGRLVEAKLLESPVLVGVCYRVLCFAAVSPGVTASWHYRAAVGGCSQVHLSKTATHQRDRRQGTLNRESSWSSKLEQWKCYTPVETESLTPGTKVMSLVVLITDFEGCFQSSGSQVNSLFPSNCGKSLVQASCFISKICDHSLGTCTTQTSMLL